MGNANCILFVDDEVNILSALRRELREWAQERDLNLSFATSAREGLGILEGKAADFALVISDLKMPEIKGSDFLVTIKERWPEIVTILLTGFSETEEVMKAVKAGIFSYILKPWEPEYLRTELTKALELFRMKSAEKERLKTIEEELKWAGEMQRALLRPNLIRSDGVEFRSSYRPVPGLYCGGDYYDVINIGNDRYLLLLGDVAGHGVKAAFVTGILKAIIYSEYVRQMLNKRFSPSAFLSWLNDRMNFELRQASNLIITFFAGVLDLKEGIFTYSNAGQTHPFLIRGGQARELPVSGSSLGFANSVIYPEQKETVLSEDTLFLYTDGLVESMTGEGKASVIQLGPILNELPYGTEYHRRILEAALTLSGTEAFQDDVTLLSARLA